VPGDAAPTERLDIASFGGAAGVGEDTVVPAPPPSPTNGASPSTPAPETPAPAETGSHDIPALAEGVDLVGEYAGSGYKEPHYIARRADGQVVQLSHLLFLTASHIDGRRDLGEIAALVGNDYGKTVSADNVRTLIEKLVPLGVVKTADGSEAELNRADPMLALKFRTRVVPERLVRFVTFVFKPLFWPPVVLAVLAGLVAMDIFVFGTHGVAQGMRQMLYSPGFMLAAFGLLVLSAMFHECGHATACRYGGATPGAMGMGVYIVWPALYTDVTDAYRLSRGGRLRTDLGGLYFNTIFMLATLGVYFATGQEWLLIVILAQHMEMVHQLLPFLRLDGYYIIADLTGVPDMFMRIKPVLASLVPWKTSDQRVTELKRWARVVVTLWVFLIIPFMLFILVNIVMAAPRIVATAWDSFFSLWHKTGGHFDSGDTTAGVLGVVQLIFLVLPVAGMAVTFVRIFGRTGRGAWRWSEDSVPKRGFVVIAGAALLAGITYLWLPNGEYTPIQPGEKGTLSDSLAAVGKIANGRPSIDYTADGRNGLTPDGLRHGIRQGSSPDGATETTNDPTGGSGDPADTDSSNGQVPAGGAASSSPRPESSSTPEAESTPATEESPVPESSPTI
jgi:putative peptide zinc metalloprotease protein